MRGTWRASTPTAGDRCSRSHPWISGSAARCSGVATSPMRNPRCARRSTASSCGATAVTRRRSTATRSCRPCFASRATCRRRAPRSSTATTPAATMTAPGTGSTAASNCSSPKVATRSHFQRPRSTPSASARSSAIRWMARGAARLPVRCATSGAGPRLAHSSRRSSSSLGSGVRLAPSPGRCAPSPTSLPRTSCGTSARRSRSWTDRLLGSRRRRRSPLWVGRSDGSADRVTLASRCAGRSQLSVACGARALEDHARSELYAAGGRPRAVALTGVGSLTAQERRVAELAAEGATNREIAQTLVVTPKTVEAHLSSTYRKLGVRSRHALAAALRSDD